MLHQLSSCSARPCRTSLATFLLLRHPKCLKMGRSEGARFHCWAALESSYGILGLSPSASDIDIKRAYRKLALQYHPDVNKEPDAQQRFMSIKSAYQSLIGPKGSSNCITVNQSDAIDPFMWQYSTPRWNVRDDHYDIGEIWEDIQSSFGEFFENVQAGFRNISITKSLWDELADLGEDFVEFIEKEFSFALESDQAAKEDGSFTSRKADPFGKNKRQDREEHVKKLEFEINEIEEMLVKLKQDLGL